VVFFGLKGNLDVKPSKLIRPFWRRRIRDVRCSFITNSTTTQSGTIETSDSFGIQSFWFYKINLRFEGLRGWQHATFKQHNGNNSIKIWEMKSYSRMNTIIYVYRSYSNNIKLILSHDGVGTSVNCRCGAHISLEWALGWADGVAVLAVQSIIMA